jgi:hypothetical protein
MSEKLLETGNVRKKGSKWTKNTTNKGTNRRVIKDGTQEEESNGRLLTPDVTSSVAKCLTSPSLTHRLE